MKKVLALLCVAMALSGCVKKPDGTVDVGASLAAYTGAATATANVLKQIGKDIVAVDCSSANIIYVIADSVAAQSRVTQIAKTNSDLAQQLCPALTGSPSVVVQTGSITQPVVQ